MLESTQTEFSFKRYFILGYLRTPRTIYQGTFPRFRDRSDLHTYRKMIEDRIKQGGKREASCKHNKAVLQLLNDLEFQLFELGA